MDGWYLNRKVESIVLNVHNYKGIKKFSKAQEICVEFLFLIIGYLKALFRFYYI